MAEYPLLGALSSRVGGNSPRAYRQVLRKGSTIWAEASHFDSRGTQKGKYGENGRHEGRFRLPHVQGGLP